MTFPASLADDKVLNQNEGEGCKVSAFRKMLFHVRKKHGFSGNGRLLVDKNNDTARIDS